MVPTEDIDPGIDVMEEEDFLIVCESLWIFNGQGVEFMSLYPLSSSLVLLALPFCFIGGSGDSVWLW